ncbi:Hypothetical predicted protein, partial [Paramuricea clavata]
MLEVLYDQVLMRLEELFYYILPQSSDFDMSGSLLELKSFVEQHLKLHAGSWTSPGGEAKVFRSEQSDFLIKWYGVSSKKIVIQVDNEERYLELLFQSLVNTYEIDENNEMPSEVIALNDSCTEDALTDKIISNTADKTTQSVHDVKSQDNDLKSKELAVCCCNCTCGSNVTKAELEGIKLDMAVLESRLVSASPLEEIKLEIKTLKAKQNNLEVVIRRQDELICKINDENMVLKSKLFSMEFLMHEE